MPIHILALVGAIIAEVVGTASLQASAQFTRLLPSVAAVVTYGISFYLLAVALKVMPVGIAYAIWSGLGIVLITLIGLVVFGQKLDLPAIIGLALIIAGVAVIQLLSTSVTH
ncbi:multidrug efflux SMR transporter [Tropicimonas sp. IMCC6043]|uniref:DMT family transporter n=1 Tax=Tropicimonas sp. IMCC6043 TaxID=2510645 RepID=UPI00101C3E49|nr:SMR family transporter [Tropicimonas sp. IMCC6043]RYH09987.1 QacE family quaternary ammonium compound efflux SMR transporter [Tropicimonas sp. IMCC6043]